MIRFFSIFTIVLFCVSEAAAGDEDHWAFQPVRRPALPDGRDANAVDLYIKARLQSAGIIPSPEAQPHQLLRRLHLDLTGLLPSLEDVDSFLSEWDSSPETAYENAVDQLLASPHFGERWARSWLDLARYADSDGYLGDSVRQWAWIYRDWVIDAINRDQPYDQFSIEQLAGDLLPDPTQSQLIATGFHRNNMKNTEVGSDFELNRTKQIVDRVATTGTTWLGLTVACAECHDHKHDPITQREFYGLYAFFNNTNDVDIGVRIGNAWEKYEAKKRDWEKELDRLLNKVPANFQPTKSDDKIWNILKPDKVAGAGTDLAIQSDGSVKASGKVPSTVTYFVESAVNQTVTVSGFKLEVFGAFGVDRTPGTTAGRGKGGEFVLSMFFPDLIVDGKARRLKVVSAKADHFDKGDDSEVAETILPTNKGWRVATQTYQNHTIVFQLESPVELPKGSRLKFSLGQKSGKAKSIRHFQLSTTSSDRELMPMTDVVDPEYAARRLPVEKLLANPPAKPPEKAQALAERSGKDRRESFVHVRGDYTRNGGSVVPSTPAILHPLEVAEPNRLSLAHWLFDDRNPLTARVAVNQIWQELFGIGLVPTSDDFGTYGDDPTHPDLLDWLAVEFRENGWSRKELIRQIVMSETYKQSSTNSRPEEANTFLWRQNSFRLTADSVRDVHLKASGLFSPKIGGPGIRPPLPDFVAAVGRSVKWPVSEGPERYRRGIYIILKRTVIYPMLNTFDAPDTSVSCSRREKTNTPMQALTLLNDPVFFECAETLGKEVYQQYGVKTDDALNDLYLRCLNRKATDRELDILLSAHDDFLTSSGSPEMAMIATARVVMNLDEFVTRD
ncbi:MAG: DUF1549 and DUF1553 domain-containing protein [Verrucomicrobiales bacterium]|nr:DUF1549 and DUF1553 domain-containing protein [Verrucomicrobiales bacterium]